MPQTVRTPRLMLRRWRSQILLLALWAVLLGIAYPRLNVWPTAYLALVPLTVLALRGIPVLRILGLTWLVAALWWLVMTSWLIHVTLPGYLAMAVYLGLYPVVYVLIIRVLHRRLDLPLAFTVPIVWVALEYVRGSVLFNGFPWFSLGHSQPTVLIQIADLFGAYSVSFLPAMTAGLLVDLLTRPLYGPAAGARPRPGRIMRLALMGWLLVTGGSLAYGMVRIAQTDRLPSDEQSVLRVAVVQTNLPQSNKTSPSDEQQRANFADLERLTALTAADQPHLIVWPETIVPGAYNDESLRLAFESNGAAVEYLQRMQAIARDRAVHLLIGSHAYEDWSPSPEDATALRPTRRYNTAFLIDPKGRIADRYDKTHRVPFGEYIPFESWPRFRSLLLNLTPYGFDYSLTAGQYLTRFEVIVEPSRVWRFAAPICFEDVVSAVARKMVYPQPDGNKRIDMLVNLTNDGWYNGSAEGPQHEQIARFRCVENRVPMARSVNTGISGFIDSAGRIVERVNVDGRTQLVEGVAVADVRADPRSTLFGRIGDSFAVACGVVTIIGLVWATVRSPSRRTQH